MGYRGLAQRKRGSREVCGCTVEMTRTHRPIVKCPGSGSRFVSRKEGVKLFGRERSAGTFCVFMRRKSAKKGKRRSR